jgi:transposase
MDAPLPTLPDDVQTLQALLSQQQRAAVERERLLQQRDALLAQRDAQLIEHRLTLEQLQRSHEALQHRLDLALRRLYGRLSERLDPRQLLLFGQAMQEAAQAMEALAEAQADEPSSPTTTPSKGHGRRPLPADLPRQRLEHALAPEELTCPCCGKTRVRIGADVSEQLDYTPASLFVIEHVRPKYACRQCEEGGVATAARPAQGQVIEKGLPGPGLVAHVATSKYADHAPLYRLEGMLARHGVEIARSTMCGWMKAAADLLAPLVKVMAQHIRESKVIHTDDTPVPVLCPGKGQTKTGRMWVYIGDDQHPYTVFDYTPTRSRDGPQAWLGDYQGYLHADAFGGYDGIYATGRVTELACWAHARRRFYDARLSDPERAHHALALIRLLYDVEREAKELDAPTRQQRRVEQSLPLLEQMHTWLETERRVVLPKSPMGTAIQYALNHWEALRRYVNDGELAIDNNVAERAIRPLVIGRKNYQHLGSDVGGRTAATLYSVIASAKRQGLAPYVYLRDVLATIGSTPISQLDQFLPNRWKQQQLEEITKA